jgi:hypothetical protein
LFCETLAGGYRAEFRTSAIGQLLPFAKDIKPPFQRPIHLDSGPFDQAQDRRDGPNPEMATPPLFISSSAGTSRLVSWGSVWIR